MPRSRNGSFSLRQLMPTLTANRTIRWPDKDGTLAVTADVSTAAAALQPLDEDLTAVAGLTGTGVIKRTGPGTASLLSTGAAGETALAASNAAELRTAAALGTIATQNANNVAITGEFSGRLKNTYISPNIFSGGSAIIDANLLEFFSQAESKFACTYTGMAEGFYLWDASVDTFGSISAGVTARVEVDMSPYITSLGLSAGSFDGAGFFVLTWYPGFTPESLQIQLWKAGAWVDATTEPTLPVTSFQNNRTTLLQVFDYGVGKVAFDIKAPAGRPAWVCRIEYHLNRPPNVVQQAALRSAGAQSLWGSLRVRNINNSLSTTIGQGSTILTGDTTETTSTTTGPLRLPGVAFGNGRGWLSKGIGLDNFDPASQPARSLGAFGGNLYYKGATGEPAYLNPLSLAAPVPASNVITVPFNAGQTTLAAYTVSTPIAFTPASTRVVGGVTNVPVIADGVNVPTLTGITMLAGSASYSNISGTRNVYQFMDDSTTVWCQILRASTPALTGLTPIGVNFSVQGSNFTTPSAGTYSSSSATAFSGSAGSAVSVPAGKDFVLTASATSTTVIGLHNNNTTASVPGTTQNWLYYTWNAAGTLFTAEGSTAYNSGVSVPLTARFFQLRRVGSQITIYSRALVTDAWTLIGTMPTPSTTALFVMLGTTSGQTVSGITLEVAQ